MTFAPRRPAHHSPVLLGAAAAGTAMVTALTVLPAASAAYRPHGHHRDPFGVTGFQVEDDSPQLIDRNRRALSIVGVDGVQVKANGAGVQTPSKQARRQLRRTHHDGLKAELLVTNWSPRTGDFDEPLGHRLLGDRAHIRHVARQLARDVRSGGWDGINLDIEALKPRDRKGLSTLARQLHRRLPRQASLSIDLSASTTRATYRAMGYNLTSLARSTDRVIVMTYEQHGSWSPQPGPMGALRWQRASVRALATQVPIKQIELGISGYGYVWKKGASARMVTARQARHLAGNHAHWSSRAGEWTARLSGGRTIWWSDHRSYVVRKDLAHQHGMFGVAVWNLRLSDRLS